MGGEKNIGVSQQTLVSTQGLTQSGNKLPQYAAAIAATLGAMACGAVLGWSSSAGTDGVVLIEEYNIPMTSSEFAWVGSIPTLGAASSCVPIGLLVDVVGRRTGMLILVVPFTIGWGLVIWANSVAMFYVGRFLTGLAGGAFCVAAPIYTSEISETEVRGALGSYFQLMITVGILFSYALGSFMSMFWLSVASGCVPIVFFVAFFFMPETPIYYLMKNREDQARTSLRRLRGPTYDVETELQAAKEAVAEEERTRGSLMEGLTTRAAQKGIVIAFGLMLFQQLSGVNAITFYAGSIFEAADGIAAGTATIILAVIQVLAVLVSTLIVDKLGRKILLIASQVSMTIATFVVGGYFYLDNIGTDLSDLGWIPLVAICFFALMFNFGIGPIPWMMVGEIFSPRIKGTAGSSAGLLNWLTAFLVTRFYSDLVNAFGNYTTFWIFSVFCVFGLVFVIFVVPETKGKSLEQIQAELNGKPVSVPNDKA